RYDEAAWDVLRTEPGDVLRLIEHPDHDLAVPTPDHFLPLLYLAGIARERGTPVERWTEGYAYGSLSMASYVTGLDAAPAGTEEQATALPAPDAPPEQSNI
ncbi:MAG TPA: hypothetical protein VFV42_01800, partial [Acidimicrobiales bacterium]|nr:hypothetical protein [Acidimicrobiales bacterium]